MDGEGMEGDINSLTLNFIPNGGLEQNSTEDPNSSGGSSSPLRSDEKVQSRYLGPHLASCHDYCKHGRKHDTEAQRLNLRKIMKRKLARYAEKNQVTKPKVTSKVETKFHHPIEVVKPQTLPSMKKSIVYGEKKTPEAFEESAKSQVKSINSGDETSKLPTIEKTNTKSSLKKAISPLEPKVIRQKESHSATEPPNTGQKVPLPPKRVDVTMKPANTGQKVPLPPKRVDVTMKPAITLKTKMTLLGSLSRLKSSRSLIRRNQEKIMRSPGTLKISEREAARGSLSVASHGTCSSLQLRNVGSIKRMQLRKLSSIKRKSASHDNVSGLQLRNFSSIKRISTPHDNVSGLQLRKLRSIKRTLTQNESVQSLQLKEVRIIKRTSAPHESDSRLQLTKLKSIKRASKSRERVPSLQLRKLRSSKKMSTLHDDASRLQPRKLKSIKRTLTCRESDPRLQLKKLKSIKRTSPIHENVSTLQPIKLRSIKRTSTPHGSVPNSQLKKPGSTKRTSTPHDKDSILQLRILKNIKRTSTSNESVSSLQPKKLVSVKQTPTSHDRILGSLTRKLRSMKRSLSMKGNDKIERANADSNSANIGLHPNMKTEESKRVISGVGDEKKRMARVTSAHEGYISAPVKLKFRRGKVIALGSDSKGARNLWLNVGNLASENPVGTSLLRRRSSRRRRDNTSFDSKATNFEVQTVVLKHQDVMDKKIAKSLLNDVIKETARKLVRTRKSKVKALVGAYETVISLLESKPVSAVGV